MADLSRTARAACRAINAMDKASYFRPEHGPVAERWVDARASLLLVVEASGFDLTTTWPSGSYRVIRKRA